MNFELQASTEPGKRMVELAEKHAADFAVRAGEHDRDATFPFRNIAPMKETGLAAAAGHASAQFNLGNMYDSGQGVSQDYQEAVKWYRLAADQKKAHAQSWLGYMYENGKGVSQDYVLALMWLNLAVAQGDADSAKRVEKLEKEMTPQQIAEAQRLAREWKAKEE